MPTVLDLWNSNPAFFTGKSIQQILGFCGDGHLREQNATSTEFREFLRVVPSRQLAHYAAECLEDGFKESGLALQEIVNQVGARIGFTVSHGRYRGVPSAPGFDGLWLAADGFHIVVEIKTTDVYNINLDRIASYRFGLIGAGTVTEDKSSILIVVGREETGSLEAQVRGSRHAWDARMISVDSLCRLMLLRETVEDPEVIRKIVQVLKPCEYTKLDTIIELIFAASQDAAAGEPASMLPTRTLAKGDEDVDAEDMRERAVQLISKHLGSAVNRLARSVFRDAANSTTIVCLPSKRYARGRGNWYWFTFRSGHKEYLAATPKSYLAFVCGDVSQLLLIPAADFLPWTDGMRTTGGRFQVEIDWADSSITLDRPRHNITKYKFPWA